MKFKDLFKSSQKKPKLENNNGVEKIVNSVLNQTNSENSEKLGWRIGSGVGQKVGVMTNIKETQQGIVQVIIDTNKNLNDKGFAVFNLVITPNHDITDFITNELFRNGVDPTNVGFHSLNQMETQFTAAMNNPVIKDALLNDIQSEQVKDLLISKDQSSSFSKLAYSEQVFLLSQILRLKVITGEIHYAVADAFILKPTWEIGNMITPSTTDKLRLSFQQNRIKAILWLVNMDKMTVNQVRESVSRLDPYGDRRFHSSVYDKAMIQITSVMSAKSNKNLQEAANSKGGWSVDLLLEYLPSVAPIDE